MRDSRRGSIRRQEPVGYVEGFTAVKENVQARGSLERTERRGSSRPAGKTWTFGHESLRATAVLAGWPGLDRREAPARAPDRSVPLSFVESFGAVPMQRVAESDASSLWNRGFAKPPAPATPPLRRLLSHVPKLRLGNARTRSSASDEPRTTHERGSVSGRSRASRSGVPKRELGNEENPQPKTDDRNRLT